MGENDSEKLLAACQRVLAITRQMVATTDLDELLGLIIDGSRELLDAERASLFLYDADSDELFSRIAHGTKEIRFPASTGIAGAAAASRRTLNIPDAYADARFNPAVDRRTGFRTRSILAVPLADVDGELVGVVQVLNKRGGAFHEDDVRLAETLAAQAGVILQRARLLAHYVEKQRMEQSLAIARDIQRGLLPDRDPCVEGFDVAGWTRPADETGGDIFDALEVADRRWMFLLADATGHGIGPALVVAEARAMLRALTASSPFDAEDLPAIMARVNDLLVADLDHARFVTCFFALLDAAGATVQYVSAGQGPILVYRRADDELETLPATALPLGVMEGSDFGEVCRRRLEPGDILAIVTDGFFEAVNADDQAFGIERVGEIVRRDRDLAAARIIADLVAVVDDFTGGAPQSDDLTALLIKRL